MEEPNLVLKADNPKEFTAEALAKLSLIPSIVLSTSFNKFGHSKCHKSVNL